MKKHAFLVFLAVLCTGCSRLDLLTTKDSADAWLASHSWVQVRLGALDFVLAEPSSSIIVYGLGIVLALAGLLFLKNRGTDKAKLFWGLGLLLWSASTFSAGTSYQAFAFVLKFAGRTEPLWTTWWEIWYLMLFTVSMNVLGAGDAYTSTEGKGRKALFWYLATNSVVYLAVVLLGAFIPNQFMASFECMLFFTGPTFIVLSVINLRRWFRLKTAVDIRLFIAWAGFFVVTFLYFAYYLAGFADILWERGIWFNANDVLHIGLIAWVVYLLIGVKKHIKDIPAV